MKLIQLTLLIFNHFNRKGKLINRKTPVRIGAVVAASDKRVNFVNYKSYMPGDTGNKRENFVNYKNYMLCETGNKRENLVNYKK